MKVAFDENIPIAMVKVFQALAEESQFRKLGLTIQSAKDYTPKIGDPDYLPKNDKPWIKRFADSDGKIIISGNYRMMTVPHERLALLDAGMIVLFFENRWNNWKFFTKCALLLLWLPAIARQIKKAKPKTFWRIPSIWDETAKLRPQSTGDAKLEKSERKHIARAHTRKEIEDRVKKAAGRANVPIQADFHELMGSGNADVQKAQKADEAESQTNEKR